MEREISKEIHERIVKGFLDIAIMAKLTDGNPICGSDVLKFVDEKFNILLSSGTVYNVLYTLERNKLVSGAWGSRKRIYKLTEKGDRTINAVINLIEEIQNTVKLLVGSE